MPATLVFPDTTVLINFSLCDEMGLLADLVGDRGAWAASVASECRHKARVMGLPEMLRSDAIFGPPLYPDAVEHLATLGHQVYFARPGDGPRKHLGESETLAIIEHRRLSAVFVTDDAQVSRRAQAEGIAVVCVTTWDLLRLAVRTGRASEARVCVMRARLHEERRAHVPHARDEAAFVAWLRSG